MKYTKLTLNQIEGLVYMAHEHIVPSYFNNKEFTLGVLIDENIDRNLESQWISAFTWGTTSIHKQIEELKIIGAL